MTILNQLPKALQPLAAYRQFILWKLVDKGGPKPSKVPMDHRTGATGNAQDPAIWLDYQTAADTAKLYGPEYGIGFVFTVNDPFFFLDIDACLLPDGSGWSQTALDIMRYVPGAAIEVSQSGKGLHLFGMATRLPHACKNIQLDLELYTEGRFVALTGLQAQGDAAQNCDLYMQSMVDTYFPPKADSEGVEWTDTPREEWNGPTDDAELIEKASSTQSGAGVFGNRCTFKQLWECDTDALSRAYPDSGGREYDGSSADAALAQHLAFWTGNNCDRMRNLMQQSGLVRDKWEREDYLVRTIIKAISMQTEVYTAGVDNSIAEKYGAPKLRASSDAQRSFAENIRSKILKVATEEQAQKLCSSSGANTGAKFWLDNQDKTAEELIKMIAPIESASHLMGNIESGPTIVTGYQYLNANLQMEHFDGCVYVQELHRVFTPNGLMLKSEQFNATYGGYVFQMDETGDKTTKKAWEAFTESQLVRYPKAQSICFKPQLDAGALTVEDDRILVNTYIPIETTRTAGDPEPFLLHLRKVLPAKLDQDILLSYMAACVQHKGVKFQWAPLLQGAEGNGKTLFTRCVAFAIGKRYTHYPKAADIDNIFNAWLVNNLFIGIEDIYVPDSRREVLEALKPMITGGDGIEIQGKGTNQITADICANFMFNSNHKDAVRKTRNDRRFAVFFTAQQSEADLEAAGMTGEYFPKLYKWLNDGGYAIVNEYLSTIAIADSLNPATACHRAPETTTTDEAISMGMGSIEQEIVEAIDEGRPGFGGGWVSSIAIERLLQLLHMTRAIPQNKRREVMQGLGYDWHPNLHNGRVNNNIAMDDGKKPRLFIKSGHLATNLKTSAEISKAYQEAQGAVSEGAAIFGETKSI